MHGHTDIVEFWQDLSGVLGGYYLAAAVLNLLVAAVLWRTGTGTPLFRAGGPRCGRSPDPRCGRSPDPRCGRSPDPRCGRSPDRATGLGDCRVTTAWLWLLVGTGFAVLAGVAWSGDPQMLGRLGLPQSLRNFLDRVINPTWFVLGLIGMLSGAYAARRFLVRPYVAWSGLNLALLLLGLSLTDPDFAAVVSKPDNVPIVGMVFLLGFFTWVGAVQAVRNDGRQVQGLPPVEAVDREKVLVWPDLVYIELICAVALTALLIVWSVGIRAPLEEPANAVVTPNPSKAPWYFVGLQELLLYYDPWMAGVVLPSLIIVGLCAIPYLDRNPAGNGYYTITQRKFAYLVFQFGFLVLWVMPILLGTFHRGPNWSFFGFFETWDTHKVEALVNRDLATRFWVQGLGIERPRGPDGGGTLATLGYAVRREMPGLVLLAVYFAALPWALVRWSRFFRELYGGLGRGRFLVMMSLLLIMGLVPIKMLARWTFNLTYFVAFPEYALNF